MEQESIYIGIDVAKAKVDVAVRPGNEGWVVPNDDAGIRQLVSRLRSLQPTMVVLEVPGGFEFPLVAAMAVEELPVVVVNPRQVRDFAKATGKLAETDALDAAVLAHFGEAVKPLEDYYCRDKGRPALHPEVLVRALLISSLYNVSSFGRLCATISGNLTFEVVAIVSTRDCLLTD